MRIKYEHNKALTPPSHVVSVTSDPENIAQYSAMTVVTFLVPDDQLDAFKRAVQLMGKVEYVDVELKS